MESTRIWMLATPGVLCLGAFFLSAGGGQSKAPPRKTPPSKSAAQKPAAKNLYEREIFPLIKKYCGACHGAQQAPSNVRLMAYPTQAAALKNPGMWLKVGKNVSGKQMPPQGTPQPTEAERKKIVSWIETAFKQACDVADPGQVTIRRLNREEYNNTVRDLMGISFRPADDFPSDDVGYGFDNIGDVLSVSPLLAEKYLSAAEEITERAIRAPDARTARYYGDNAQLNNVALTENQEWLFYSVGTATVEHRFERPGLYRLRVRAYGQQAGPEPCKMAVDFGGKRVLSVDVAVKADKPTVFEIPVQPQPGKHKIAVTFLNDYYQPENPEGQRDRNLIVDSVEVVGPLGGQLVAEQQRKLIPAEFDQLPRKERTRKVLERFATRAFRRPVTTEELDRLCQIASLAEKNNESFERGIQLGMQATLVSPHFLFRVERDPKPNDPQARRTLNPYELASRLSYFLWSSMPDDALFAAAKTGDLLKPAVLRAHAVRMLKDPKAEALADNFAGQWLQLRKMQIVSPDPKLFPAFNEELRKDMVEETRRFFLYVKSEDRPILDFLDGRYTFLNERLARHYGVTGVAGNDFRRVPLTDPRRGGVITHASVLTVTSNPNRTSPVKRGKWVLDNILNTPPPPPPPGVGDLKEEKPTELSGTLRQRMEQHRKDPVCASCHQRMDPIGFAMENFDPVGGWRAEEGNFKIDPSGNLPDGTKLNGPATVRAALVAKKGQFSKAMAEKMLIYALGRGIYPEDQCHVDEVAKKVTDNDYRFSALILGVVESEPFRNRRGQGTR